MPAKLNLEVNNEMLISTFSLKAQTNGDDIQAMMRMLEPYITIDMLSYMQDLSVQCYELGKLLLRRESYKEEPHSLQAARDRVYIHRISRKINKGGI